MRRARPTFVALVCAGLLGACSPTSDTPGGSGPDAGEDRRPNILLVVADDLGYADLGSYGSEIRTPHLDRLAQRGLRFARFHTAPMCAPTRAMLLSGNDNHVAGMGWQGGGPDELAGRPGYEGFLSDRVVPLPAVLADAGYRTYSVGKWHLGTSPDASPTAAGFQRSFQLLQGAGTHFDAVGLGPPDDSVSLYWADGGYTSWPEGAYSTELYTDRLLDFLSEDTGDARPFFAYAAYTSPHWPLQVPDDDLELYRGTFDAGYDALRERNLAGLKEAGLVARDHPLPPRLDWITPWSELTAQERRRESRKMELYAAMVENLDRHVGRLLQHLEDRSELDNTLVVFMSDNGAAAEDFYNTGPFVDFLRRTFDNGYELMGTARSHVSYGPPWAEAGSAPFRGHKQQAHEGGIVAPMIVAGPGVTRPGEIEHAFVGVADIAPTLVEVGGGTYPGRHGTPQTRPMTGASIVPLLTGTADAIHPPGELLALSHREHAYVRLGSWKLVSGDQYRGEETFELFDLAADPAETTDVSAAFPAKRAELLDSLAAFRARVGVVMREPPPN